ncbi:hypothetical protein [Thiorhodococcus fuscus]|uniref:Uncharacterized protein n=1 Tax=Thiorhodococcus fuscus TaxID=527200 RepID=A0ABW4Y6L1_9GAMM
MAEQRFDIAFDGRMIPGADPVLARRRLQSLFKLDEAGIARLFSGKPVFIKRDVDAPTANQFEKVFNQLGAILRLIPIEADDEAQDQSFSSSVETGSQLSLAPQDGFLEEPPTVKMPDLDLSHLSLVQGSDWSLEDCEAPPPATQTPDTSHLSLAEIEPDPATKDSGD